MSNASDDTASPILEALYRGDTDAAQALATDADELDFFEAAALGRTDRLRDLLTADPGLATSWGADGFMPLHLAAFFGHAEAAALLLEHGADAQAVSRHEFIKVTPLHSAVAQEGAADPETTRVLLDHGASPNTPAEGGGTPLHSAAANGDRASVELLLNAGADPHARREDGRSPLDLAREAGHEKIATLLG
jgi:ankyrin repeat protein